MKSRGRAAMTAVLVAPAAMLTLNATAAEEPTQLFRMIPQVAESSGLTVDTDGYWWTMGDAGNAAALFAVDSGGTLMRQLELTGTPNEDWEDVASGQGPTGPALFVGDIGDGYFERKAQGLDGRKEFRIIVVPRTKGGSVVTSVAPEQLVVWPFRYPDGAGHNSEGMLLDPRDDRLYLVEKPTGAEATAAVWALPEEPSMGTVNELTRVGDIAVARPTGAAMAAGGDRIVVRDEGSAYVWTVGEGQAVADAMTAAPTVLALPRQRQGEGVAFSPDGTKLVLSSEGAGTPVIQVALPAALVAASAPATQLTPSPPAQVIPAPQDLTEEAPTESSIDFEPPWLAIATVSAIASAAVAILGVIVSRRRGR